MARESLRLPVKIPDQAGFHDFLTGDYENVVTWADSAKDFDLCIECGKKKPPYRNEWWYSF